MVAYMPPRRRRGSRNAGTLCGVARLGWETSSCRCCPRSCMRSSRSACCSSRVLAGSICSVSPSLAPDCRYAKPGLTLSSGCRCCGRFLGFGVVAMAGSRGFLSQGGVFASVSPSLASDCRYAKPGLTLISECHCCGRFLGFGILAMAGSRGFLSQGGVFAFVRRVSEWRLRGWSKRGDAMRESLCGGGCVYSGEQTSRPQLSRVPDSHGGRSRRPVPPLPE
jgi:hypothetical protein